MPPSVLLRTRAAIAAVVVVALCVALVSAPQPVVADEHNPWMDRPDLTIGHRGATFYGPENTLHSMRRAVEAGAQVLEFDLFASAEGEIVVIHDQTVDRTTDGSGAVGGMTVEQLRELDAGYWHVDGRYSTHDADEEDYVYRGIATGDVPPPPGYRPEDFRIPTLEEVLETFPDVWLLFEIKDFTPTQATGLQAAERMAELLEEHGREASNGIIASFDDRWIEVMMQLSPQMSFAPGLTEAAATWASLQGPQAVVGDPRYDILFLPEELEGIEPVDPETVANANDVGYAVHVFSVNECEELETFLDAGVHGIVTDDPGLLEELYAWRGVRDVEPPAEHPCDGADERLAERAATPGTSGQEDDPDDGDDDGAATDGDGTAGAPLPETGAGTVPLGLVLVLLASLLWCRAAGRSDGAAGASCRIGSMAQAR